MATKPIYCDSVRLVQASRTLVSLSANAQAFAAAEIATTLGGGKVVSPMGKLLAAKLESGELNIDSKTSKTTVDVGPGVGALLLPHCLQ